MITIDGWKTTSLPLLLRLMRSGGTPDTSRSDYYGGDISFVTIEDMTASNRHLTSTIKALTDEGLKHSNAWLVPANSILYSIYATLGLPRINTVPVTTNQAILALINDPNKIDRDYLYYWLEYIRTSIFNFSSQTTQSNLSASIVKTFLVDHPTDLSEQSKIAEILSTVDRAIEQTEALIAKQQRIKTGLMQDLLTRGIDGYGNLRSEQTHKFKDTPLGRIPVEWEVKKIFEVSTKVTDGDHHTPQRSVGGFYLLSARNVNDGYIDLSEVDYVPTSEYERMLRRCNPEAGDILVSCSGTIGRVCEVPDWLKCVLVRSVALIKFNREAIISRFAEWTMRSSIVQFQILVAQRQAAQPNLFQGEIENLQLPKPRIEEQQRIADVLDSSQADINRCQTKLRKLRSLKIALMQDLLTGKKRVTALLNDTEVSV